METRNTSRTLKCFPEDGEESQLFYWCYLQRNFQTRRHSQMIGVNRTVKTHSQRHRLNGSSTATEEEWLTAGLAPCSHISKMMHHLRGASEGGLRGEPVGPCRMPTHSHTISWGIIQDCTRVLSHLNKWQKTTPFPTVSKRGRPNWGS